MYMAAHDPFAKNAVDHKYVSMDDTNLFVETVAVQGSVSTDASDAYAKNAADLEYAKMAVFDTAVKTVEALVCVFSAN